LFSPDKKQVLAVNGEIYNHQDIRRKYAGQYEFQTGSDCEVILALYREKGIDFLETLVEYSPLPFMMRKPTNFLLPAIQLA
jgi:asparagine synthase (glutamine-hydrolysing)